MRMGSYYVLHLRLHASRPAERLTRGMLPPTRARSDRCGNVAAILQLDTSKPADSSRNFKIFREVESAETTSGPRGNLPYFM